MEVGSGVRGSWVQVQPPPFMSHVAWGVFLSVH